LLEKPVRTRYSGRRFEESLCRASCPALVAAKILRLEAKLANLAGDNVAMAESMVELDAGWETTPGWSRAPSLAAEGQTRDCNVW
jgi:hypothetical protein